MNIFIHTRNHYQKARKPKLLKTLVADIGGTNSRLAVAITSKKNRKIILENIQKFKTDKSYKIIKGKKSKLNTRNTVKLEESILNTTSPYVFANKYDQRIFEEIVKDVRTVRLGGDCYSYCLLADGHVDIVLESGIKPWDIRALEPIIKNAGGVLKTWEGDKVFNGGRIIAAANKKLFKKTKNKLIKKKPS